MGARHGQAAVRGAMIGRGCGRQTAPADIVVEAESFWHLWYRYLWPFPYFRDASSGDGVERLHAYRYNSGCRGLLPGFILKWLTLTLACYGFGFFFEVALGWMILAAVWFTACASTLTMVAVLSASWMLLARECP